MPIDDAQFKHALSHFASGVTIVTTEHEGTDYGLTVASFASLSLSPPLVLVCISKSSSSHEPIAASGKFGVSILGSDQEAISGRFASPGGDKFAGVYGEREAMRYPVLYMQDGQNLFEPQRAFVPGQHWRLAEAADEAINERTASPMIVVGVDHAGPARIDEYTPTRDAKRKAGGKADAYGRMLL